MSDHTSGRVQQRPPSAPGKFVLFALVAVAMLLILGPAAYADTCDRCHKPDALFSHPVNVTPTMKVPDHLPLENGRVTCRTCHEDATGAQHSAARQDHSGLVRAPGRGVEFCLECHSSAGMSRQTQHALSLGTAHPQWAKSSRSFSSSKLDADSRMCLSCHDGSIATEVASARGTASIGGGGSHPVGVTYENRRQSFNSDRNLQPAAMLDKRIQLSNGQVACTSCHSLYSKNGGLLVMSNDRSRLCLSCHQQ